MKHKKLHSLYGKIPIDVLQDRDGDFEPQIVPKRKKDISEIEQKIIARSAKGMTTRQISDIVEDIYGFEVSEAKNRGVQDILILCTDELSGIKESIAAAYPNTEYQRSIVHQVCNLLLSLAPTHMPKISL